MTESDDYRRRSEALLSEAAKTYDMKERGRLIDEAMQWHLKAMEAHARADRQAVPEEGGAIQPA